MGGRRNFSECQKTKLLMSTLLKDLYNDVFFEKLIGSLKKIYPPFNLEAFEAFSYKNPLWPSLSLKERSNLLSNSLHEFLSDDFTKNQKLIIQLKDELLQNGIKEGNLECIFLPQYFAGYGLNHFEKSFEALEKLTAFSSGEFAIRAFLKKDLQKCIPYLRKWLNSEDPHLRRLASEGSRPLLPWGGVLVEIKESPEISFSLLEPLLEDPSKYVQKSVANHLNDVSKNHPSLVLDFVEKHFSSHVNTLWIFKHALRTLLKEGNPRALQFFGYSHANSIKMEKFAFLNPNVNPEIPLAFSFDFWHDLNSPLLIRIEYHLYFLRKNGDYGKKVFKISEKSYLPKTKYTLERKHSFKAISTRTYYPGIQKIALAFNGIPFESYAFNYQD
ncbi:MAG: DNA alkylation repair protein [Flavobacteriaceae bacterium]|nr:MAG: DNA alkylation repair protein [Flavobacteriaceae bacterium]